MTPERITFICLVTKNGYQFVELTPQDAPWPISPWPGVSRSKVYEYCPARTVGRGGLSERSRVV